MCICKIFDSDKLIYLDYRCLSFEPQYTSSSIENLFQASSVFDTLLFLEELTNENLIAQCNFTTYVVKNYLNFWRKKCPKNLLLPKNLSSKTDRIFGTDTFLLIRGSKGKRNKPIYGLISLLRK